MKNKIMALVIILAMLLQCLPLTALAALEDGTAPVGQWSFDEGEGITAADTSGNDNHGTMAGPTWIDGMVGKALSFSGNGCVEIPHHASLNPRNALTIEAWVNPSTNMNWRKVISKSVGSNTDYSIFQGAENNLAFSIKMGSIARTAYAPANSVPLGEWTYVVGTYDGCRMKLYLNGTLVKTINISGEINAHAEALKIGGEKQGAYFEGEIDEVKIYNEALTAAEILSRYEAVTQTASPTIVEAVTTADGTKVLITFDKDIVSLPVAPAGFTVAVDGVDNPVQSVGLNSANQNIVELTLTNVITSPDSQINLSYTVVGEGITSVDGGIVVSFCNQNVFNNIIVDNEPSVIRFDSSSYQFDSVCGEVSFQVEGSNGQLLRNVNCWIHVTGDASVNDTVTTDETGSAQIMVYDMSEETVELMVEAENGISNVVSITFLNTNNTVPNAPIISVSNSNGNIIISWADVENALYYQLERKVNGEEYIPVGVNVYETKYIDGEVVSGKTYYYRVTAINNIGESPKSEEVVVDYTTPMDDLGILSVDKNTAFVGESTSLTIRISPKGKLANNQAIKLTLLEGTNIISETLLKDDGDVANGDDIDSDGVYSGVITVNENEEKELVLFASAQVNINDEIKKLNSLNEIEIDVISHITASQTTEFQLTIQKASDLLNQSLASENLDSAIQTVTNWLKSNLNVIDTGVSDGCNSIWFIMNSGIRGVLPISPEGTNGGCAVTFNSDYNGTKSTYPQFTSISQALGESGYTTQIFEDDNVTVEEFKMLNDKKVILINCHGSLYNGIPFICTGELATSTKIGTYEQDLKAGRIIIVKTVSGDYFGITPAFITEYNTNLPESVVFLASCRGLDNDNMWKAFSAIGAKTVLGFSGDAYKDYVAETARNFFSGLLNDGLTVGQAYDWTINEIGESDNAWKGTNIKPPAYFKMYGEREISLNNEQFIINGDFEDGFNGWTVIGDARIITQLGPLTPVNGNNMAIISTGLGSVNDSNSLIEQKFYIPTGCRTLSFDYNVVSEEPMEYVGGRYDDKFACIFQLISESIVIAEESVNTSQWTKVEGINFAGGDGTAFETRWKHMDFDVTAYAGNYVTLNFHVWDVGDSIYDTAALIDNVKMDGLSTGDNTDDTFDPNKQYLIWPVESTQITLPFGKIDEITEHRHIGIDIQSELGADVFSASTGIVVFAGDQDGYGNVVYINSVHGDKQIQTRYAHLSEIIVEAGEVIGAGDLIGTVGNSGNVFGGYVLHFEVLESTDGNECDIDGTNAVRVDPQDYLMHIRSTALDYLSLPFAIGIVPGDELGTMSVENLSQDQRYERDLDLNSGEAYLRKLVNVFSRKPEALTWDSSSGVAVVRLNGKTKYYGVGGKYNNAINVNARLVVNREDFIRYFFPTTIKNAGYLEYPGYNLSISMKNEYNIYVLNVQQRLKELLYTGLNDQPLNVNGHFDENTFSAVNSFKKLNKLGNDGQCYGVVGQQTWSVLFSSNVKPYSSSGSGEYGEYKDRIDALKKAFPNWQFEVYDAGIAFDDFVAIQYNMNSPVPKIDKDYKETDSTIIKDRVNKIRKTIKNASNLTDPQIIKNYLTDGRFFLTTYLGQEYYGNPANFLKGNSIFAFLQLDFDETVQTKDGVKLMLKGTYFENDIDNFTNWFYDVAKQYGLNPYFLIAKAIIEGGAGSINSTNPLLIGYKYADGTVVYNYFGIGATDGNATKNGANYAKNKGWTTPLKAIEGGIKFIGYDYIGVGQDTYYTMRYNIPRYMDTGKFSHQYASNIADHVVKGSILGQKLRDFLADKKVEFKIPSFR